MRFLPKRNVDMSSPKNSSFRQIQTKAPMRGSGQAFVQTVDSDILAYAATESFEHHGNDGCDSDNDHSISSSISSKLEDSSNFPTMTMKNLCVDDVPGRSGGSCEETKSKSLSTTNLQECDANVLSRSPNSNTKPLNTVNITNLLAEREALTESMMVLGRHIPYCVTQDLIDEILRINQKKEPALIMPHATTYTAALLFIDMSGFTKLSLSLDLETLSRNINFYFQKIIDEVTNHAGDVLKFAGDAIFAEWRINKQDSNSIFRDNKDEIHRCVMRAANCGADIVAKCSDYPVFDADDLQIGTLNVHCGLAYGEMAGVHVGNDYNRREFLVLGESIDQATKACDAATYGQLMASPEAYEVLQKYSSQKNLFGMKSKKEHNNKPIIIASRHETFFEKTKKKSVLPRARYRRRLSMVHQECSVPFDNLDLTSLKYLRKLLSFYTHPVVVSDENTRRNSNRDVNAIQERHRAEAELRSVYTVFIKPIVQANLSSDPVKNEATFKLLNDILLVVTSVLDGFRGHLRQFIVDDKGVILIATFGLRGSTSPNMAAERVLPASRTIHYSLQNDLGIDNYVGITLGKVYCGVVGGIKRHEYAVLGPSVNLAARLLSMPNHPGILINNDVRREAIKWGTFLSFPPMKAKGYSELVPVCQPLTATEARWGKVNPLFVGRKNEMMRVCNLAHEMAKTKGPAKMFFVWGETGSGKSDFLVQTISLMRKKLVTMRKRVILTRNVGNEGDSLVPFSLFRSIFRDLLRERHVSDNASMPSKISKKSIASAQDNRDWESYSLSSFSTMHTTKTASAERLNEICAELGAPQGFLHLVGYHLLGHTKSNMNAATKKKGPILNEIVNFMAKLFIHCTSPAELTVVALDDMHHTDNLSWKVVQKIYETGENILFVCGSRPFGSRSFVDDEFWNNLNQAQRKCGRFEELDLGPLDQSDIAKMVASVLSCKVEEVDRHFVKDIFDHTRGMPHFAFQFLESCKRQGLHERLDNNKIGWREETAVLQFSTLDELLLQRIDGLDDFTRKTLHLASVLGHSFTLMEILGISEHVLSIGEVEKSSHANKLRSSLDKAVENGVLDESIVEEVDDSCFRMDTLYFGAFSDIHAEKSDDISQISNLEDLCYLFCHDTWRQKILSLLLDSYKRDIHMHAASAMQQNIKDIDESDYGTKMRLFVHLRESGNTSKAAELAVNIGKSYVSLGLNLQSIHIYDDALNMWRKSNKSCQDKENDELVAGFSLEDIESLGESDLISVVKLFTALGQALGTLSMKAKSHSAFEAALEIFKLSPVSIEIKDRSFIFPIYSGLFFLLKYGGMTEPSEAKAYEQKLVSNFVEETRLHGDPVHYSRSLAMQGEFFSRQGEYDDALNCHRKLKLVYDVEKHSALVVEAYASDRSAQNYGNGANCLYRLGRVKEALELSFLVLDEMMPKMDLKNVHNSMIMIYPVLWILKHENMYQNVASSLERYVFEPFCLYFGEDGKTFSLPLFKPLRALFHVLMFMNGEIDSFDESWIQFALDPNSLSFSTVVDNSMANFGRCGSSIGAEMCLLLSRQTDDPKISRQLVEKGWKLVQVAMKTATNCGAHQTTYFETKPVYDELSMLFNSTD